MDANIKSLQDALEWLLNDIHQEAARDGEMTNANAIRAGFITNMLAKFPRRNCDVGTAEGMTRRYRRFCDMRKCDHCSIRNVKSACTFAWAQMPY